MATREEEAVMAELQNLQRQLGRKQSFEEAVAGIVSILRSRYSSSSPTLRKSIYSSICRVATILRTRYTAAGFWLAGLKLFEEAEPLMGVALEREHLKSCIEQARSQLHELEIPQSVPPRSNGGYLFEGHLTVGPEPPPPAWLVAQNFLTTVAAAQDLNALTESSRSRVEGNADAADNSRVSDLVRQLMDNVSQLDHGDLESAIEASLREIGAGPQKPPPASKEVVANLPIIHVSPNILARLGQDMECAVCRENLVLNDTMQELPCQHLFHPPCLKPWLDEHNSCPICRHELRTDDHEYESRKEREREAEEDRKGAENALPGGEYMYV